MSKLTDKDRIRWTKAAAHYCDQLKELMAALKPAVSTVPTSSTLARLQKASMAVEHAGAAFRSTARGISPDDPQSPSIYDKH